MFDNVQLIGTGFSWRLELSLVEAFGGTQELVILACFGKFIRKC
jgi:hypothetical protein